MDKDHCYRWAMYNRPPVTGWSTARADPARRRARI